MKYALCLFALYFISIAIMPCADSLTAENKTEHIEKVHDQNTPEHADECPVFCVCNCCGIPFFNSSQLIAESHVGFSLGIKKCVLYKEKPILCTPDAIWQPPKV